MRVMSDNRVLVPLIRSRHAIAVQRVGPGEWVAVGFADQLSEQDAMMPATIGWHGVHVARDPKGELRGRLNAAAAGGCFSIPSHCATTQNVRCANLGCSFSANPGVLDSRSDPDGASRRQFTGNRPDRMVEVPVEQWGPLLFVNVSVETVAGVRSQLPVDAWLWNLVAGYKAGALTELVVERTLPGAKQLMLEAIDAVLGIDASGTFETGLDSAPVQVRATASEGAPEAVEGGTFVCALRPNVIIVSREGMLSLFVVQFEGAHRSRVVAADIGAGTTPGEVSRLAGTILDRMTL